MHSRESVRKEGTRLANSKSYVGRQCEVGLWPEEVDTPLSQPAYILQILMDLPLLRLEDEEWQVHEDQTFCPPLPLALVWLLPFSLHLRSAGQARVVGVPPPSACPWPTPVPV
ncbi:hypothetical protein MHYP_G00355190 [Metynnis hypsauchen]